MKNKTVLGVLGFVVVGCFALPVHACDGVAEGISEKREHVFYATHHSVRCPWRWGDKLTTEGQRLSEEFDSFEAAEAALQPFLQINAEAENLETVDRNNNGIVDQFTFYQNGLWYMYGVSSPSLNMHYGDVDSGY